MPHLHVIAHVPADELWQQLSQQCYCACHHQTTAVT
jgi:hypothetical protein